MGRPRTQQDEPAIMAGHDSIYVGPDLSLTPAHPEYVNGYTVGHQDGHAVGYAEGHAAGLRDADSAEALELAEKRGEARGYANAKAETKPPLFEAAKQVVEQVFWADYGNDDQVVRDLLDERVAVLEADYGQRLSGPDRGLLWQLVHRRRTAARAQREALIPVARPRSPEGVTVAKRLAEQRAETVYETVS